MRVLTITPPLPTAGEPGSMAPAARQIGSLQAAGVEMDVIQMRGPARVKYLLTWPRVRRSVADFDLVHAHFGYCGWLARGQGRRPIVLSFMGSDLLGSFTADGTSTRSGRAIVRANRWLAPRVDAVIVKSAEMAAVIAPVPAHIVPNGVNLDVFQPTDQSEARRELGWEPEPTYVLFPGNPENPRKNLRLAKEVVAKAEQTMGRSLRLMPLWNVEPDRVAVVMNACDAMLMMSLKEGSPNVVKEAMACDLPVVSVPVGDVAELLDGVEGNHVRTYEADDLAPALVSVLADETPSGGRDAIISRGLDLDGVARRIINIYESVLN